MKKLKPILFAIVILILLLFIIGGMLGLLPQPLFVLSSQTILVILVCGVALIIGLLLKFFDKKVRCLEFLCCLFNQKELVVCSNQPQYQKYTSLLEKAGITYRTKARDLSSPSLFSMGTRERAGTAFQKVNYQTLYAIYVRKADYDRAVHVILV